MKIVWSRQVFTEQTDICIYWAPVGAKNTCTYMYIVYVFKFHLHFCFVFLRLVVVAQSFVNIQLRRMRGSINFFVSVLLSVTDDEFMVMSGNWKVLRCSITTFKTFLAPRQWWAAAPRRPGPVRWCAWWWWGPWPVTEIICRHKIFRIFDTGHI